MSRLIASLLKTDHRDFAGMIYRLEHILVQSGIDVQLTAEIITGVREKSRSLGLDPADTSSEELYYALIARAKNHAEKLREKLSIDDSTTPAKAAKIIAQTTEKLLKKDKVISMHSTAVKKILKSVPPKKTLKALKYRSLESVLKREDPMHLYALANRIEDKSWHTQVNARIKRLESRDAIEAPVKVLSLSQKWLDKLKDTEFDTVVQTVPEIGSVLILPSMPLKIKGSVLLTVSLVLQAGQRMAIESLPFRVRSMTTSIEKLLPDIASGVLEPMKPIHGLLPSWHAVYRSVAEQSKTLIPDYEFILSDMYWESTEVKLSSLVPEMDFWIDTHFVAHDVAPLPVSFHLIDVVASLVLNKEYTKQIVSHMRSSLWNELQVRYIKHESIEKHIVSQLTLAQGISI